MRRLVLVSVCAAMLVVGGAALARESASATEIGETRIDWTECGAQLECADVWVPLDWDRPNGRKISLAVIRRLASGPEKQIIGSMFVNPGGPGESGVELVRDAGAELDVVGQGRFHIVGWDPRGTNKSTPVECFKNERSLEEFWEGVTIPITKAESRRFRRKTAALARRCGKVSGTLLRHISTADTVRDLDYLRELVGDQQLTYLGLSYGTFLGQTYANMFPDRVRAMALDGISDAVNFTAGAEARTAGQLASVDEVWEKFQSLCENAGPDRCALAGQEPVAERVEQLVFRLRHGSIPAPSADPPGEFTYADLQLALFAPIRVPSEWPKLAKDLNEAADGDASALEMRARASLTPKTWKKVTTSTAIQCADGPARRPSRAWPRVIGRFADISEIRGRLQGWWTWAPCASWPTRRADRYTGPWDAATENPILLIGTRYDPNTAYANARRAEIRLGNAVLLTHDGYGHLSSQNRSECVERARSAYLVDLITPAPGTVCPSDRIPFDPDFEQPLP